MLETLLAGFSFSPYYVIAGAFVGFVVGLTGVGGGSLMTPILIQFGIQPSLAVGTDLLYAAITKSSGVFVHQKKKNIDWHITKLLAFGSLPASLATLLVMHQIGFSSKGVDNFIKVGLGITIIFTAIAILSKQYLLEWSHRRDAIFTRMTLKQRNVSTVFIGIVLGVVVTVTSIGAGALGTVALFLVYPILPTSRLIGTEIAHAVPLTLVAGLAHAGVGNVDWSLLGNLLIGSLPGIYIGSHIPGSIPDKWMRPILAAMLLYAGSKLLS
jgi:hypothetical protein